MPVLILLITTLAFLASGIARADFQVQEKVLGPADDDVRYILSPRGAHLAVVARKGSRLSVMIDGVAGPRVEEVLTPALSWVDASRATALAQTYNTSPGNVMPAQQVTFCPDGTHSAYLAKMSNEWVLFRDGAEVSRVPSGPSPDAFRLEFSRDDGGHLMFICGTTSGDDFFVDGQKWPGKVHDSASGGYGPIDPTVSPDGEHIACYVTLDGKETVVLDGKPLGYTGEGLRFTPDSQHLICVARTQAGQSILVDGKPLFSAKELLCFYVAPAGHRIASVLTHFNRQTNMREGVFLIVDGKPVEPSLGPEIKDFVFSPDGRHYAAICGKPGTRFMVLDGKKGEEYQDIDSDGALIQGPHFSPDSSKLIYLAHAAGRTFVVVNTGESDAFSGWPQVTISPDSKHIAITGATTSENLLVLDGTVVQRVPLNRGLAPVVFSPDSNRYAAAGGLIIDGATTNNMPGTVTFSPDSKHYAVLNNVLCVDGEPLSKGTWNGIGRAFSPDSQHICWITREPNTAPDAAPNSYVELIYVDGKPVIRLPDFLNGPNYVRRFYTIGIPGATAAWLVPREWSFADNGTFVCIAPDGPVVKRFTITLTSATSVATAISDAKAAATRRHG